MASRQKRKPIKERKSKKKKVLRTTTRITSGESMTGDQTIPMPSHGIVALPPLSLIECESATTAPPLNLLPFKAVEKALQPFLDGPVEKAKRNIDDVIGGWRLP